MTLALTLLTLCTLGLTFAVVGLHAELRRNGLHAAELERAVVRCNSTATTQGSRIAGTERAGALILPRMEAVEDRCKDLADRIDDIEDRREQTSVKVYDRIMELAVATIGAKSED